MMLVEWMQTRPYRSAITIGALLGVLWGVLATPPEPPPGAAAALEWSLPAMTVVAEPGAALAAIPASVWGAAGAGGPRGSRAGAAAGVQQWRLLGIVAGPEPIAIVQSAQTGAAIQRLAVGDPLPDGARILAIGDTLIRFERDGCRHQRTLYAAAAEPEPECGEPAEREGGVESGSENP